MNKQDKPLSEWTLGELKDWCGEFSCDGCPVGNYEGYLCQFGDCTPDKWDLLNTPAENAETTPAENAPAQEPEADKPAKPRLAEILGVEVGEEFSVDIKGVGEPEGNYCVNDKGIMCCCCNEAWPSNTAVYVAISHPERIVRKPRLTEPELAICRAVGAKYVSLDRGVAPDVELWESKPDWNGACFGFGDPHVNKRLARVDASLFPSVKPGDCIAVEEASGNV